ncbi:glutamate synthase large subunit [Pseudoalteromonas sp. JB197]|uniref:glutamate synthase large subunit n=1 Tax=Pseudoalteromonas sp. JB197 TaxID=1434839 RepID=UPI00097EC64C|nr:glutamate synthase large subunit [Pseudoalteromonas sp. JB197]PCC10301.1 glutamate synthase large subunit [Pseudoalteromonas sp. JB197]SJN47870.1 Glutamate synthase [NADPH] large chain [Pseudoalteromonas sp. JB197]
MNDMSKKSQGLYRAEFEHDSCGIGFVANLKGKKSHDIIENALTMLSCMEHRGGTGFDVKSGDGAGILIQIPHEFFRQETAKLGWTLPSALNYGVGMIFFPRDKALSDACKKILNQNIAELGLTLIGYRDVPGDNSMLGAASFESEPNIEQVFIAKPQGLSAQEFERKLFVLRKYTSHKINGLDFTERDEFYVTSMSSTKIVYKGQFTTEQVRQYYLDLQDERTISGMAMFHSRFSTNTFPAWRRAQPFRYIAHNGEINTVRGNINWMNAREALFSSVNFSDAELNMLNPVCNNDNSDSANLDMAIELLVLSGRSLAQVMMMMVPEAWQTQTDMDATKRAFYEYYACIMEPWDGPASLSFTDGNIIGATLDRNGLRPSRYLLTEDGMLVMGSETGTLCIDQSTVVEKGRLQPGKIFIADLEQGRIISDDEVKQHVSSAQPYARWLAENKIELDNLPVPSASFAQPPLAELRKIQKAFGYTSEDLNLVLAGMVGTAKEPLGAMGTDTPLAVLSHRPQQLSHYFKQLFAQVTNPPIDPIREELVMSLRGYIGRSLNLLDETPGHCHKVEIEQPVLTNEQLRKLQYIDNNHLQAKTIDITFKASGGPGALKRALDRICLYAKNAVEDDYEILILSDRGVDSDHVAIPSVLATAAVHHYLIREKLRSSADIILESGDIRETHHFATVIGYGAAAVNPYLALESMYGLRDEGVLDTNLTNEQITQKYTKAVGSGLLKTFSKMGISTLQSYLGAQVFEALGINSEVIDQYFTGTVSRIEGLSLDQIAQEALLRHREGFPEANRIAIDKLLPTGGEYSWRHDGERHLFNPTVIRLLQHSTASNNVEQFKQYAKTVDDQSKEAFTLRGLLQLNSDRPAIALSEVEPVANIFKRFASGAMSFGSISWEAHTTLAIAMNRIGGKSNSGEGGEDPIRYTALENGDSMNSRIKQVASGRFGVTSHYLANADELQIKMAQGAKPGEGGQLPGDKVDAWIGKTRGSTPGVGLISPPPHHDIYSIEDLSQLIFDLKNANRDARINVKLVSEAGVGTVASGVAKAYADVVLIAGHDGGTGASPLSSIKHTGLPWELGLAETHQTLVRNKLRSRITVQTDGQLKTPRDLAIATLLGAEEYGMATTALVVEGCIMMRKCHLNTCPVGIATQDKGLRDKFTGRADILVNFFTMMAEGLREIMAELGFRSIEEMVGQTQCLTQRKDVDHWKYQGVDLTPLLHKAECAENETLYQSIKQKHLIDDIIDRKMIKDAQAALESGQSVALEYDVINTDRTIGAMISNEISKKYHADGLPQDTIKVKFNGSAGQSFGCFSTKGLRFELEGDANDYFGKGLSGANLVVYPSKQAKFAASENILIGNVAFFGATSGSAFIRGIAGERFCVRNSGATAVVEGVGDHGCEYMTGGKVVILGATGRNFAAGMSGGVAYVLDVNNDFAAKCNMEMVALESVDTDAESHELKALISQHFDATGSDVASDLLKDWNSNVKRFVKVMPVDYKRMQGYMNDVRSSGKFTSEYDIAVEAFDIHLNNIASAKA